MRGLEKNDIGRGQINTQTHGHVDSMTNSAQRAELMKITQPLGTNKITQPLGTKKSHNLLRQKNVLKFKS